MEASVSRRRSKILIFGTSYVEGPEKAYVFNLWEQLNRALNPTCDLLVVDSASPDLPEGIATIQLGDNIGHLDATGRDGWGRAFTAGLEYAIEGGYDYVIHMETDLLCARPIIPIIARMKSHRICFAAPLALPHQFIETALMFIQVPYIRGSKLAERYGWANSPQFPKPESRIEGLVKSEFWTLLLRGCRNDLSQVTPANINEIFYLGCDWITHCKDLAVYRAFLKMNGFGELAR